MPAVTPAPVDRDLLARVLDPTGSGRMLPREAYTDDAVLAWEREQFFARTWLCAGRVSDLREPGQRGPGVRRPRRARSRALASRINFHYSEFYVKRYFRISQLLFCEKLRKSRTDLRFSKKRWS